MLKRAGLLLLKGTRLRAALRLVQRSPRWPPLILPSKPSVDLTDGRTITVPLAWYPRLLWGTPRERNNWRLIGEGEGIHWPDLDEDLSVENLLSGKPSGESQASFRRWVESRKVRNKQKRMYRRRG